MQESKRVKLLGWVASITGVAGALIVAVGPESWIGWAFWPWLVSNICWMLHSYITRIWAQWVMQATYLVITYLGIFRHFGLEFLLAAILISLVSFKLAEFASVNSIAAEDKSY